VRLLKMVLLPELGLPARAIVNSSAILLVSSLDGLYHDLVSHAPSQGQA
jgi:hypothetical protein